jgi:hypothetical protein
MVTRFNQYFLGFLENKKDNIFIILQYYYRITNYYLIKKRNGVLHEGIRIA